MDEPTAALGVKGGSTGVASLTIDVNRRGLPIILISQNTPTSGRFPIPSTLCDLARRIAVIDPKKNSMAEGASIMTGAIAPPPPQEWAVYIFGPGCSATPRRPMQSVQIAHSDRSERGRYDRLRKTNRTAPLFCSCAQDAVSRV